jgi:hypothetical protein
MLTDLDLHATVPAHLAGAGKGKGYKDLQHERLKLMKDIARL